VQDPHSPSKPETGTRRSLLSKTLPVPISSILSPSVPRASTVTVSCTRGTPRGSRARIGSTRFASVRLSLARAALPRSRWIRTVSWRSIAVENWSLYDVGTRAPYGMTGVASSPAVSIEMASRSLGPSAATLLPQ